MGKDLLVLADEYAAATATFARALALKDEADSMSPIAREAGDKRAVLAEALAALDTAQPALSGCACRWDADDKRVATCVRHQGWLDVVSEWAERAKAAESKQAQPEPSKYGSPDLQALILNKLQQAQPERAPLTQTQVVEAFCELKHNTQYVSVFDAGVRYAEKHHGIKQGGQHEKDQ